jgi:hypothetical protein
MGMVALGLVTAEGIVFVVLPCVSGHRIAHCANGATRTEYVTDVRNRLSSLVHFLLRSAPYVILCIIQMRAVSSARL